MKHIPLPFQAASMDRVDVFDGSALVSLEMGLGKTPVTLWRAERAKAFPLLVVCPAGLKGNWEREAWKFLRKRATVLDGTRPPRKFKCKDDIVIINYDILGPWLPHLMEHGFVTVAFDEGHYLKSRRAKRTKFGRKLARVIPNRQVLTGTPITNRPAELWPLLNIIAPDEYNSFFTYALRYCQPRRKPWGWTYLGAANLPELHRKLKKTVMIRYKKNDVLKDLPLKVRRVVALPMSKPKEYHKAFSDLISWLSAQSKHKAEKAARAMQLSKTNYLRRLAARLKLPAVFDWVDAFLEETDGKLCLFAFHRSVLDALQERYKKLSVRIDGNTPKHGRADIVDSFNESDKLRLFLGQTDAAGVGLNITGAHSVAFVEMCWTPSQHVQAEDRCYGRLSDLHGATCYYLVADGSIEEDIVRLLHKKQKIMDAAIDGASDTGGESVFNALIEQLQKKGG